MLSGRRLVVEDFLITYGEVVSDLVVKRLYANQPQLLAKESEIARRDVHYHIQYLAAAIGCSQLVLFVDYVSQVRSMFNQIGLSAGIVDETLAAIRSVLMEMVDSDSFAVIDPYLSEASKSATSTWADACFITGNAPIDDLARSFLAALIRADRTSAEQMLMDAIDLGLDVRDAYSEVFERTLREVGRLWMMNRISVADEHYCTACVQWMMSRLYDRFPRPERRMGTVVAACAANEQHEVGLRMVCDSLEMAGWSTYYLGANVPAKAFVRAVREKSADLVALSATYAPNLVSLRNLVAVVREGISPAPAILVGGYPFAQAPELVDQVGADAFALNARDAVAIAERIHLDRASSR